MKLGTKILLVAFCSGGVAVLAAPILLESPCYEYDHCSCGMQRQWACFEFAALRPIRFMKFHTVIKRPGDPTHTHDFCTPQYIRIDCIEFFRFVLSPINPVQPTRASARG